MNDIKERRRLEKVLDKLLIKEAFHIGVYDMNKYVINDSPKMELKYVIHFDKPEKADMFKEEIKNSKLYTWVNIEVFGEWKNSVVVIYSWDITKENEVLEHEKELLNSLGIDVGGSDEEDLKFIREGYKDSFYEVLIPKDRIWGFDNHKYMR
ncbi:hypothetical protein ACEE21_15425 [Clostridium baratii]